MVASALSYSRHKDIARSGTAKKHNAQCSSSYTQELIRTRRWVGTPDTGGENNCKTKEGYCEAQHFQTTVIPVCPRSLESLSSSYPLPSRHHHVCESVPQPLIIASKHCTRHCAALNAGHRPVHRTSANAPRAALLSTLVSALLNSSLAETSTTLVVRRYSHIR